MAQTVKEDDSFEIAGTPCMRPDLAMKIENRDLPYLKKLGEAAGGKFIPLQR